jgi:hypothetical protein
MDFKEAAQSLTYRNPIKITQTRLWLSVAFYLPESVAMNLPATQTLKVRGQYLIGFNFKPQKGEVFPYEGHLWKVTSEPIQFPARYKTQNKKYPPYLMTEYLDSYQDDIEMMFKLIEPLSNS